MGKEREMGWMENEQHKEENHSSSVFFLEEIGTTTAHLLACHTPRSFALRCVVPCCVLFAMLSVRLHVQQRNTSD